jgi:hypothetical protein
MIIIAIFEYLDMFVLILTLTRCFKNRTSWSLVISVWQSAYKIAQMYCQTEDRVIFYMACQTFQLTL